MTRLIALLFLFGAMLFVPAVAFAQDDATTIEVTDNGAELPDDTEQANDAVDEATDLDSMSSLEYWQFLAMFLPVLIGKIGAWLPRRWRTSAHMAQLSTVVYLVAAVIGAALKGSFDSLTWDTPQLVAASFVKIAFISYTSYKVTGNAFPKLVGGKPSASS
jgi:hypothetical protein